jgi:hypothetical protein
VSLACRKMEGGRTKKKPKAHIIAHAGKGPLRSPRFPTPRHPTLAAPLPAVRMCLCFGFFSSSHASIFFFFLLFFLLFFIFFLRACSVRSLLPPAAALALRRPRVRPLVPRLALGCARGSFPGGWLRPRWGRCARCCGGRPPVALRGSRCALGCFRPASCLRRGAGSASSPDCARRASWADVPSFSLLLFDTTDVLIYRSVVCRPATVGVLVGGILWLFLLFLLRRWPAWQRLALRRRVARRCGWLSSARVVLRRCRSCRPWWRRCLLAWSWCRAARAAWIGRRLRRRAGAGLRARSCRRRGRRLGARLALCVRRRLSARCRLSLRFGTAIRAARRRRWRRPGAPVSRYSWCGRRRSSRRFLSAGSLLCNHNYTGEQGMNRPEGPKDCLFCCY